MRGKIILAISIIASSIFIQPTLSTGCDSNSITLRFEEAHAFLDRWDYKNATEIYDEVSESCHPNATVWITEGRLIGSYIQESSRCFDRAIEICDESPRNATTWNNKGWL